MPDTGIERIVFGVGVVTIVALALALALVPACRNHERAESAPAATPAAAKAGFGAGKTAARAATAPTATPVKLRITASSGDCWVEVRERSSTGRLLYEGTLVQGKSFSLIVKRLWVRFGAAGSVDVALDGKPVAVPEGTVDVLVTPAGIQSAA